jgi:hypothetical protein
MTPRRPVVEPGSVCCGVVTISGAQVARRFGGKLVLAIRAVERYAFR